MGSGPRLAERNGVGRAAGGTLARPHIWLVITKAETQPGTHLRVHRNKVLFVVYLTEKPIS